ncbi:phage tail spike protein [Clostridium perfringens]|uniref:phage tail spike protein n=3 Tax=Clostridium perfringens TaxID=1502 RepID=UPI0028CC82D6|nr:phage tail spike protein [Clostridium perfringens]MDT7917830.1 phage tail spike protein [Clostridium perfringens]MDT7937422.1 phage tail spike protein [Clostridium perfringens]MDT7940639.1 phage tail spike protein [Clostridium perfringens]MDT7966561.1 phage tail spike protein [Clostridium perfringens]MDT7991250.1 phage tail spike protein [Clostridium perfringens]
MIELRDKDKNRVAGLVDYENLCIESVLESGDKTLSFYYPKKGKYYDEIVEEGYIITKKDEFVVKARELDDDYTKFECSLNLEELEGTIFDRFESVEQTITSALNLAIVGTGWTVKDNTLKKRRTIRCTNKSSLEIVREIKKVYRVDIVFNTLKKQIEVYEHLGEDKGTYFIDSLNLIALQVQSDSRQYATRIIAEGKDGLSFSDINNGKNYVENYQYSNKVKTIYWKDERYSVKESLLEDARAKLEELSKPFRSYSASILNLAELNPRYSSILDFKLGDVINLISKKNKIKDKQRIVKIIEWPQDHTKDSVELANATLKFEDIQQENQETSDTVSNITTDNGTINGSTIDSIQVKQIENFEANVLKVTKLEVIEASINHLSVIKADIQELNVVKANIGTLEATKANITELNSVKADLQQAIIGKANITDLNAAVGKINVLESKTASIENVLLGNLTAENFKANSIVAGSGIIADGAIGSAQISSLSVNKLEAGDITTSKHRIVSADGTIEIVGNQILINRNNINKVILGEYRKLDNTTDYGLLIRGKDGRTVMFDSDGVHNAGITDGAIDNNKVADNANISGNKLDINSVIREVNTHGTETIKGTKVAVGDRTLDVELSTQKNTITEHSKELSSQKASLTALDNALKFKVDSQTFTQSTTTINNNINRAKEEAINLANNAINNLQISFRNLAINSNFDFGWKNWGFNNPNNNATVQIIKDSVLGNCVKVTTQTPGQGVYSILKRKPKTTYSWSFMIKSDKTCKITVAHEYGEGTKEISLTTEWTKITGTGIWNGNGGALCFYSNVDNPQITYYLTNLIYVEGDKVGDWTPAPEDLKAYSDDVAKAKADLAQANAIANADGKITTEEQKRIQQAQENLNIAISKADKAKQDAILEANRIAELKKQEAINSSNSHADSKANEALNNAKAFVNSEITNVNTHLNKNTSEINILKGQIESKVSQSDIDKSIQNIKFNDVNMILNSGEFKDTDHWSCTNGSNNLTIENRILKFKFTNYASWGCYISNNSLLNKPLDISKKYTVVCKLKASKNQILTFNICDGNSYNYVFGKELSLTTEWQIFKFTFNPTQVGNERQFRFITSNLGYDFDLYIEFVKMVEGATSSDSWSMAPEYVLDNIKTVTDKISTVESKFTQENNSIKASVQDLNSTTQSITTNVSNINRDLTSKINSNLDVAKNFATDIAIAKANLAKEQAIASADGKITDEEQKRIQQAQENLNTAISKADKAKQDAINEANRVAELKKQEAINSANSHADNKANEALNNAKAFVNAEITTVNNKVHNVESNLNILSNEIKSKVSQSDIDKSISEIKLGGRNLLSNTYKFKNLNNWSLAKGPNQNGALELIEDSIYGNVLHTTKPNSVSWWVLANYPIRLPEGKFTVGKEYTISFYAKSKEPVSIDISFIDANGLNSVSSILHFKLTTEWKYYYGTIRANATGNKPELYITSNIGEHWWTMFKLEEGNKPSDWSPAPEDTTSLVEDSIRVIDTKITDVSSSVTQLRDSVTTQINSINSKTHSIETTLGGKASKQEVTEVNNRVATIKASLDGIKQRVSATESKAQTLETNLNGKASKQEVNNVSSKVVSLEANLNGITNRVSSTESRINTLDGKVASAVTNQQFTEFKQSNDKFKFTVEQRSSISNILPNGSFFGGDRGWLHNGSEFWAGAYSGYGFKGRITGAIKNRAAYNNPERYLQTHKAYKVKKNTTYTINFHYICEKNVQSMDAFVVLSNTEYGDYAQPLCILTAQGGSQSNAAEEKPFTYKFNTGNHEWVWIRFDHNGMKSGVNWDEFCWIYVSEVGIYEGDVGAVKWVPKGGEVYSANYQMDELGFKGTFEDGTYASLGRDGLEWYNAGTGHAYHALTYVTSFDIPVGNPGKAYIKLPAEFTKRRSSLKWTVALRGYYYNTTGNFFPFHVHCTGARDYIENGLVVCEVQGLCKIQNGSNSGDVQFRPLTAMLIAIA